MATLLEKLRVIRKAQCCTSLVCVSTPTGTYTYFPTTVGTHDQKCCHPLSSRYLRQPSWESGCQDTNPSFTGVSSQSNEKLYPNTLFFDRMLLLSSQLDLERKGSSHPSYCFNVYPPVSLCFFVKIPNLEKNKSASLSLQTKNLAFSGLIEVSYTLSRIVQTFKLLNVLSIDRLQCLKNISFIFRNGKKEGSEDTRKKS